MASEPANPKPEAKPDPAPKPPKPPKPPLRPRDLWPIPLAILSLVLAAAGIAIMVRQKPGPDFEGVLRDAEVLLERQQSQAALELLNGPIVDEIGAEGVDHAIQARFHALRGEALFLGHRSLPAPNDPQISEKNNTRALEELRKARSLDGLIMTPRRLAFLAETLMDLGRFDQAVEEINHLPDEETPWRHRLMKRAIEIALAGGAESWPLAADLLSRLRNDPKLPEADRAWVAGKLASAHLAGGKTDTAIDLLLPELQRMSRFDQPEAGELLLLLGRAYLEKSEIDLAAAQLARAEQVFLPGDERRAWIETMLARISLLRGDIDEARDRFASVVDRYTGSGALGWAYLGLAESEASLGRDREALRAYSRVIEQLGNSPGVWGLRPDTVFESLGQKHENRTASGHLKEALEYAMLAVRVGRESGTRPAEGALGRAMFRLAEAHKRVGESILGKPIDELDRAASLRTLDPEQVERARIEFVSAGKRFEEAAPELMIAAPEEASQALFNAADAFDRAGDQRRATALYTDYISNRRTDPNQLDARYRLARCFQSLNEYDTAIRHYEEIIRDNAGSDEALRSLVPLAQCHLLRSGDAEQAKAEELLMRVLSGRAFSPEAPQFKRALIELAQMYLRVGRNEDAIARLTEALKRYPDGPERVRLTFDLAEANRLSSGEIDKKLEEAMPLAERTELRALRERRLRDAQGLYEEVRTSLERENPDKLTEVRRLMLRNAMLYRGDCAFDLGDFDRAIYYYDTAAQRYESDPAMLVAMVQIVNCYAALGKLAEARTAHSRAQLRLKELPESSWQGAFAPMNRDHWEQWFKTSLRLEQEEQTAAAQAAAGQQAPLNPDGAP